MRISFKASCFLPNKAMDHKLIPFQRVVLTLQDATNPGPVAQFVKMQCSFKVYGACQRKWAREVMEDRHSTIHLLNLAKAKMPQNCVWVPTAGFTSQ